MKTKGFKKLGKIAVMLGISAGMAALNYNKLGIKDSGMLFIATLALVYSIHLVFKDVEASILFFIVSFPILVTARKGFNIDILIFKLTYESIYVMILFLKSFKSIKGMVIDSYKGSGIDFKFLIYTFIFVIFSLNSSLFSANIQISIGHTFLSVLIGVMFGLSLYFSFKGKNVESIYYALILMCDLSCLYGFMQIFQNRIPFSMIGAKRHLITFGFHNVNIFAGIAILVFPLMLDMFFYGKKKGKDLAFIVFSLGINTLGLFITYTRGAWLALLAALLIVLISKKYRFILYGLFGLMAAGIKPIGGYILRRGTSTSLITNESTIARLQSIFASLVIIKKYPFGAGSGSFADMYKRYVSEGYLMIPEGFRKEIKVATYNMLAAHNLWLHIAVELGVISMVAFLGMVLNRLFLGIKNFKKCRGEVAAIVSYIIYSLITGIEFEHKGVITGTLVLWIIFMLIQFKAGECKKNEKGF